VLYMNEWLLEKVYSKCTGEEYKAAIQHQLKGISWQTVFDASGNPRNLPSCKSVPEERIHYIYVPDDDPEYEDSLLHEINHAFLAENVHPLFGSGLAVYNENCPMAYEVALQASSSVSDWYVESMIISLCPNESLNYLDKTRVKFKDCTTLIDWSCPIEASSVLAIAYRLALAFKYLDFNNNLVLTEKWKRVINCFEFAPVKPSIKSLRIMINQLLEVFMPPYQVKLVRMDGAEQWKTYRSRKLCEW
jgi:hypothetical protein